MYTKNETYDSSKYIPVFQKQLVNEMEVGIVLKISEGGQE
jgi:hypothetical protein